jgi:hypothetical protein
VRLSAEQFETILSSLKSYDQGNRTVEKRRSPRVGLRMTAMMIRCGQRRRDNESVPVSSEVKIRNVSTEGIGLTLAEPIVRGEFVILGFRRSTGELLSVLYKITHCQRLSERVYAVGARFDRVITAEEANAARRKQDAA